MGTAVPTHQPAHGGDLTTTDGAAAKANILKNDAVAAAAVAANARQQPLQDSRFRSIRWRGAGGDPEQPARCSRRPPPRGPAARRGSRGVDVDLAGVGTPRGPCTAH